jgi:hypothetical protein
MSDRNTSDCFTNGRQRAHAMPIDLARPHGRGLRPSVGATLMRRRRRACCADKYEAMSLLR